MNKDNIREIVYILVAVVVAIIAVNLFIWLLPFILIALLALFIYGAIKKKTNCYSDKKNKKKSKRIVIIDEESD